MFKPIEKIANLVQSKIDFSLPKALATKPRIVKMDKTSFVSSLRSYDSRTAFSAWVGVELQHRRPQNSTPKISAKTWSTHFTVHKSVYPPVSPTVCIRPFRLLAFFEIDPQGQMELQKLVIWPIGKIL